MKLRSTIALLASGLLAGSAWAAPADITSLFLTNYQFDDNFDHAKTETADVAQEICDIPGWDAMFSINYTITGVYEYGFGGKFNNGIVPASGYEGSTGGALALSTGWGETIGYTQTVTLPKGKYTLRTPVFNGKEVTAGTSQLAWIPDGGTKVVSTLASYPYNAWQVDEISWELTASTKGKIQVAYKAAANGSANSANLLIDYVQLLGEDLDRSILTSVITDAEKVYEADGSSDAALKAAIDSAKAVEADSTASIDKVLEEMNKLNSAVELHNAYKALQAKITEAEGKQAMMMSQKASDELAAAITAAKALAADSEVSAMKQATNDLAAAIKAAEASAAEYKALADAVANAEKTYDASMNGAEDFKAAIDKAKALSTDKSATSEQLSDAIAELATAELLFLAANGTGDAPEVTTNPYIARGCKIAFGRLTVADESNVKTTGFCWSDENKEPTIADHFTTFHYTHNGNIYCMKDLKAATIYYMRAFAISNDNQVGYGDVVKVVMLPEATCTWSWNRNDCSDEVDARCRAAIGEAIDEGYNLCSAFKGFHLTGNYAYGAGAGDGTADCSYGGWMRISQNVPYQKTGTVQHETNHGVGVGTTERWYNCAELRENTNSGLWLGPRANALVAFLEDNSNIKVNGDGTHMWPKNTGSTAAKTCLNFGINGAQEDSGEKLLYYANALVTEYLCEDGLNPTSSYHNGVPCYTMDFDPDQKYYIVAENKTSGLNCAGFIYASESNGLAWKPATEPCEEAAWNISYNLETGYYTFTNAKTGTILTHKTNSKVPNHLSTVYTKGQQDYQLLPARSKVQVSSGSSKFVVQTYWMTWYESSASANRAMKIGALDEATGVGSLSHVDFDFRNSSTQQRWAFISESQLPDYVAAVNAVQTGVETTVVESVEPVIVEVYTTDGVRLSEPQKGVNLVRFSDGTTRKVVIR